MSGVERKLATLGIAVISRRAEPSPSGQRAGTGQQK